MFQEGLAPIEIAHRADTSKHVVNQVFIDRGLQERVNGVLRLTELGRPYGRVIGEVLMASSRCLWPTNVLSTSIGDR